MSAKLNIFMMNFSTIKGRFQRHGKTLEKWSLTVKVFAITHFENIVYKGNLILIKQILAGIHIRKLKKLSTVKTYHILFMKI